MAACAKCKKSATAQYKIGIGVDWQSLWNTGSFTVVEYQGPSYPHNVGSPTGIIATLGIYDYGRKQRGMHILVHKADVTHSPEVFVQIDEDDDIFAETLTHYKIEPGFEAVQPRKTKPSKTVVTDVIDLAESEPVDEDEPKLTVQSDKDEVEVPVLNEEGQELLTREKAILLTEFRDRYGYNHHLEVMGLINSGKLLSYKDGKRRFVYHKEK